MNFRQKLIFMALGSTLTLAGYLLATLVGDVTAQTEVETVDQIVCRELKVVDANGKTRFSIGTDSDGNSRLFILNATGEVAVLIATGIGGAGFMSCAHHSKNGVLITAGENGGAISVNHASGEMAIMMGIGDTDKEGVISVKSKDQDGSIQLSASKYGGDMAIFNNGSKNVLQASVDVTGGGLIRTRDKNFYRTGSLP